MISFPSSAVQELAENLKLKMRDPALLEQALTHPSYLNEDPAFPLGSNQRLEFLGDAVIHLVVAQKLCLRCPQAAEGELTRARSQVVRRASLAHVARSLGLGKYLRMGRGEEAGGGRQRESNLEAALEAVVGAVFLDRGYRVARALVLRLLRKPLEELLLEGILQDAKARLQEVAQGRGLGLPRYELVEAKGPDHAPLFTTEVKVGAESLGRGHGRRRIDAEQAAAAQALEKLL